MIIEKPKLPGTYYVRWAGLVAWMRQWGYGEYTVRRMVAKGEIKRHVPRGNKQALYIPAEVERDVFLKS